MYGKRRDGTRVDPGNQRRSPPYARAVLGYISPKCESYIFLSITNIIAFVAKCWMGDQRIPEGHC